MNKKLNSIALSILLVTSTFTFLGAFTLFPQQAEAQAIQLRVSAALNPAFQSKFFGPMIVQAIIDDPSAADPGDSTVGLQIKDTTQPRVHLGDGLWYSFFADRASFLLFLDVVTDGIRNDSIATRRATAADATHPATFVTTGTTTITFAQTLVATSAVRELTSVGGVTFVEIDRATVFPTLPVSIDNAANNQRSLGDSNSGVASVSGDASETCDAECGIESVGVTTDSDWPFIELVVFNENSQNAVRAGSLSVTLTYKDFAESITAKVDRSTSYPVNADVIITYTDFMQNINPVETEIWDWVLDKTTGNPTGVFYQFNGNNNPVFSANNPGGLLGTLFRPNLNFDTRQVLELSSEGITTIKFFDRITAAGAIGAVVAGAVDRTPENARLTTDALFAAVQPVIRMRETVPNAGTFESQAAGIGGRSDVFTGANDKVANFDFFDIISSVVMTQHDGFATVDREVYDSADRAVFTVTDPDQNLRSRVSEQPSAVRSNSFVKIGNPWPLANNPTFATFFGKNTINEQPGAAGDFDFATTAIGTAADTFNRIRNLAGNQLAPIRNAGMFMAADPDDAAFDTADEIEAELNLGSAFAIADVTGFTSALAAGTAVADNVVAASFRIDVVNPDTVIVALDLNKNGRIDTNANALTGELIQIAVETNAAATTSDIRDSTPFDNTALGRTQKTSLDFTTLGITAANDKSSAIIVNTNVNLSDLNKFQTFTATGFQIRANTLSGQIPPVGQAFGLDPLVDGTGIFVTPATGTATGFVSIGPAGLLGSGSTVLADATVYKVMVPEYNLIRADLSELVTGTEAVTADRVNSVAVQIEAICPAGATVNTCTANGKIVRTIVDFTPFEAVDVDADFGTGTTQLTGSTKVGTGVFRVADLLAADWDGDLSAWPVDTDEATNLFPNIRLRFTVVTIGTNGGVGEHVNEPSEVIDITSHVAALDIDGLVNVIPPPNLLSTAAGAIVAGTPTFAATRTIDEVTLVSAEHALYRIQVKEQGVNSSIFTGRMDFETANQLDTTQRALTDVVFSGDPAKAFMPNRFIPPNRLAFAYSDVDIVAVFRATSASFIFETRDGKLEWDKQSYSFGQDAFLTLTDEDLNRRPDATERYDLPVAGFVFFELGKQRVVDNADRIALRGALAAAGAFLNQIDGTLLETGSNTGTFVSQITMPSTITISSASGADAIQGTFADDTVTVNAVVNQKDLEANYEDVRDKSSIRNEFDDVANIRTTLGDVVLDRAAYPPGALMFIEIHDNDNNTDVDIRETINLNQLVFTDAQAATQGYGVAHVEGDLIAGAGQGTCNTFVLFVAANCAGATPTAGVSPLVEINVFKTGVGRLVTLLPAGMLGLATTGTTGITGDATLNDRFGTGITTNAANRILPILDRNSNIVTTALETGPNTGIFEFEVRLPGPASEARFPVTLPAVLTTGTLLVPIIKSNQPIQVTYTDPATSAGDTDDVEELATFLTNTARLRTDKLEYGLGDRVDIILEEPDFNLDSRSIDEIAFSVLDIVTDKFDSEFGANAATTDFGTVVNSITDLRMNTTKLRESNFNSGVFVVAMEELTKTLIDRGETARLLYFDRTPSGGGSEIRVQYTFLVVSILPEIVFDKEEYTPFDEVTVSIISPDSNNDQQRIETISPLISTSSESLGRKSFPETGPNTGIFEQNFDLSPDKARFPGDVKAIREDGVTVEFRIDSDTVATKSVFVNYHVGQVMFDKDAFRMNERGVLRVIDPDANVNPNTIDTLNVRFWSTTDRGGLLVTLRETGDRTGIFEEIITFSPDEESSGTRLRVNEGDTITAKYTDSTLPAPAALDTAGVFTVEVEELFASALIGSIVPPLERAVASVPELVDQTGAKLTDVSAGSQVLIQSKITNSQTKKQPFAYIVQIKDKSGVTTSLSWVTGELPAKESLAAAQSWIPDAMGEYTVEVFVWQSVDNPTALSPVQTTTVTVK